jgi:hypothetical protein
MKEKRFKAPYIRGVILAVAVTLSFGCLIGPAMSADGIDPDADKILRSMSTYLGNLSSFSVKADLDHEIVDLAGQKLLWSSSGTIIVDRPEKIYAHRRGPLADMVIVFDGKTLALNEKKSNVYARIESPGVIDDAFRTISSMGLDAPAADLLYADSYSGLITEVTKGAYLGTAYVHGVECHHLAFRAPRVDWQLWVQTGDTPLPLKYVITNKWVTGAPQYVVQFRDWNTKPQIEAGQFTFTMPEGARNLETILVNELGELIIEGGQK